MADSTDATSIIDTESPEAGGLPPAGGSGGQTEGQGSVGSMPLSGPTSPSAPSGGASSSQIPFSSADPTMSVSPATAASLAGDTGGPTAISARATPSSGQITAADTSRATAGTAGMATGAAPSTATTEPISATPDTGRVTAANAGVTAASGAPAVAGASSSPDQALQNILPLLGTAGALPTQYVTETMDPSGAVSFGTSTTDPGLAAFDPTAAGQVANWDTGQVAGGTGLVGQFSPTSTTQDPWAQQFYGQGDRTMTVDQVRGAISDPAWTTYNAIIQQFPQLAGQIDNPDALMQAIAGQNPGAVDPESNLAATSAELQNLLINQPAVVAARGGSYVDITQDPNVQAAIAQGNEQAIANFNYQQQYGGGRGWTKELSTGATNLLTDPLVEAALIYGSAGAAAPVGAALDIGAAGGAAVVGAGVGAAEAEAQGGNPLLGAALGGLGGYAGSELLSGALPTGGTPGEYGAATFGGTDLGAGISTAPTGGAGDWYTAAPPGSSMTPTGGEADWYGTSTAAPEQITPGAAVTPADVMGAPALGGDITAGMDPNAYLTGSPVEMGSPASVGPTLGVGGDTTDFALSQAISAGGVDPFAPTAPLGEGGLAPSYDMPGGLDTGGGVGAAGLEVPDITQMPEDYSWLGQAPADTTLAPPDTGAAPGESFPQNAAGAGRGVTDPTGDYAEQLRTRGLAPPTYGDTTVPQSAGSWSDVGNFAKSALKWGSLLGTPLEAVLGGRANQKALQSATQQLQQSTAPAQQVGQQLINQYQSGNLPAGQQAAIDQWMQSTKAVIRQKYVDAGAPDSTAEAAAEAYVGQTANAMYATQMNAMLKSGLDALGQGAQGTQAAINAQLQGDQQLQNQIMQFMNAYGGILRGTGVFS